MRDIITKKTFNNIRKRFIDDKSRHLTAKETVEIFNEYFRKAEPRMEQTQVRTLKELENYLVSMEFDVMLVLGIYMNGVIKKRGEVK